MTDFDRTLKMDAGREQHSDFHSGIETVTCEEDLHDEDHLPYLQSIRNQGIKRLMYFHSQVSDYSNDCFIQMFETSLIEQVRII